MTTSINIPWEQGILKGTVHYPYENETGKESFPLVIICHGFIGSRIGVDRLFVKTAKELALHDYVVLRFDYSGCGESDGEYGKTGLDQLIEQTRSVIDFGAKLPSVDSERIILLGHSLGGATATLTAAADKRIKKLILWAAVGEPFKDLTRIVGEEKMNKLVQSPAIDYHGYLLYRKFFQSLTAYFPLGQASSFRGDTLVVHGTDDRDIPVTYCQKYYDAFLKRNRGNCSMKIIEDANHTFSDGEHFQQLINATKKWLFLQQFQQDSEDRKTSVI